MSEIINDVLCPVCKKGKVVTVYKEVANRDPMSMIMGPGGKDNYRTELSYHCSNLECLIQFAGLPGVFKEVEKK